MSHTSVILKKSLSGISGVGILQPLFDYNRRPREWKSLAYPVLDEALERKVQFLHFIGKHDERRGVDLNLRDISNFDIGWQPAARQGFAFKELVQVPCRNPDKPRFVNVVDQSI